MADEPWRRAGDRQGVKHPGAEVHAGWSFGHPWGTGGG